MSMNRDLAARLAYHTRQSLHELQAWERANPDKGDYQITLAVFCLQTATRHLDYLSQGERPPEWHAAHAIALERIRADYPDVDTDA